MNIKEKYIETFFGNLTKKDKKEIYFDQYMWHAFSFEKITAKEGYDAIKQLELIPINSVYVFFQHNNIILEIENITYKEIFNNIEKKRGWDWDCYVVDKDFKWTFVFTHETINYDAIRCKEENNIYYLGPYFLTRSQKYRGEDY